MTLVTNVHTLSFLPEQCFELPVIRSLHCGRVEGQVMEVRQYIYMRTHTHQHIPFLLTLKWRLQQDLNRTCKQLDLNTDSTGWILNLEVIKITLAYWDALTQACTVKEKPDKKKDRNMHHTMFVERSHCYGSIFMQTQITQTLFWCLTNCISCLFLF